MESPSSPPLVDSISGQSSRSRSSTKLDDVTSLTSFNPFSEEDEHDQSSYTLVTSIFSRMKNTLSAPLSSAVGVASSSTTSSYANNAPASGSEARRPSYSTAPTNSSNFSSRTAASDRPNPLVAAPSQAAPPIVSLTPAQSELPTYTVEYDHASQRVPYSPGIDVGDNAPFGTSIPGFPIQDDARSIKTTTSLHRSGSVSKVMRRLRGEGLSRDYWMDDENCKECYDCKSVFSTWRRKHHCRICGQIFCSRCASNIIKGARFGSEGMVRVCNLCLEKLAKVEEDDDDDRRSVVSSVTTFPAHQMGIDPFTSMAHPQSPFAASQLFGRDEPFNLFSIAETRRPLYGSDGSPSHSDTPLMREGEDGVWETVRDNPAPFRRGLSDEEKDHTTLSNPFNPDSSGREAESQDRIRFLSSKPIDINNSTSSIQFPIGSPEQTGTPRLPNKRATSNPYGEFDVATPFIRSRVQSRLETVLDVEPGWRTRRESTAYAQELNLASMLHLKIMLRQMLTIEEIPNIREWEETLLRLALRIAREMTFTALPHRQGQDMDVRRYVKIKKIPGGMPKDSEFVTGAVITKNVAHKQMSRMQANPRVMLVTFPLEFSRVEGQYMHFGQIVRQEKEYLGNLASRIAALRPHVVLVEKSVSRLALDALAKHNIAVARTVKPSAIQTIARMTQGDVFSSMDKLALEPRLGHCARYCIQTYDHPLIPGRRKTYMRFEGCNRDMGCTIILRGGNIDTLKRIKKVTRFLTFIVRNLKLETHLWKDSVISLPSFNAQAIPSSESRQLNLHISANSLLMPSSTSTTPTPKLFVSSADDSETAPHFVADSATQDEDLPNEDAEQLRLTRRIDESLEPYTKTFISVSSTLRFPPPYPIRQMKELDNMLLEAKRAWEDEVVRKEERFQSLHQQEETITAITPTIVTPTNHPEVHAGEEREDIFAQIEALPVLDLPSTPLTGEGLPTTSTVDDASSYFTLPSISTNSSTPSTPGLTMTSSTFLRPEEPEPLKTAADIYHQSHYTLLKWQHEEFRRIWEWHLRKNSDDFVVEKYQCIYLREYTIPSSDIGQRRPCFAPRINYITFYGENDLTLGQFIEKSVNDTLIQFLDPKAVCTGKGCEQPLARHCKVYVHNETTLFVAVEQWDGQIIGRSAFHPSPDLITTWSMCRVCGSATPFIPVSEEMQRYSFAKFLELHFYPADIKLVQGAGCQHNIYQHHIRYFASKGMTVRFQADPIVQHEIVYPPFRIRVRPETQLELRNADFERLHYRNMLWYTGLIDDLKLISIDAATGDEETDARLLADINTLIMRAETEREDISRFINQIYRDTAPTDTLALNKIHAYRQDKIVAWQMDFDRLPKPRPVQNTINRNSNRSSAFDSVRAMWPRRYDLAGAFDNPHLPSSSVSEAEEGPIKSRRMTGDSFASSASDTSEPESSADVNEKAEKTLESVVSSDTKPVSDELTSEEHHKSDPDSDSTIGAPREDIATGTEVSSQPKESESAALTEDSAPKSSRLPRRTTQNLSVAELVKKYQDFLPAQGVHDLAQTAFAPKPAMSESEQEYPSQFTLRPAPLRSKSRHRIPVRKQSTSDFEQGYAANVAPRYLTHSRRSLMAPNGSRIPAPKGAALESEDSSRRPSPEKRSFGSNEARFSRPSSPHGRQSTLSGNKQPKNRIVSRSKDKSAARPSSTAVSKSTFRRPPTGPGTKVSNIAKHFERLGRDAERSKSRYAVIRGRRARPVASARAKVEVLDSVKDAIRDDSESSDSSEADDEDEGNDEDRPPASTQKHLTESEESISPDIAPETIPSVEVEPAPQGTPLGETQLNPPPDQISMPPSPFLSSQQSKPDMTLTPPQSDLDLGVSGTERNSILKALSGFWPQTAPHSIGGDDPMSDPEHIFRDSSMVVRLDEPTSIIALALNSPQYRDMLSKSRAEKKTAREAKLTEGGEAFMPDDGSIADSTSTWGVVNLESGDSADPTEDLRAPSSKLPWAITFESGGLTISCTVLYPEQFDALRRTYDCEKSMVESLSRCVKWNASGGKSGSAFLKTRDDRFIAKELSKPELQTMETFAPAYFDYMSSSVYANRPTLLAKVFGCYKLTFRKTGKDKGPGKSKSTQMNLLVMENLFYDRRFSKIYDLKGSTRNRHVQSTGRENEVLLDENLVEAAHLNPFYLREHSKRILRGALYNDSKFLADINVMDYSLVCGVDSRNNELVVGIVDYIRTYTWDKKLESWVKESAFLGGAGRGEPTIVTPKQYRQRFISAMERYFPLVPDRWMKQGDTPEEESSIILSDLWPDW
ncbi:hypothetical protein GALMADRAFT_234626 [Galerina marginata CBS 339.88]|uniref:1-phosphatidylinositol-3-phosphate 5-kinase n=1 Tax=Galerina marginata (strain CBS 339.88) TaxID=685588 RepID=A0A067TQZ6_GALM3|nr:hypothetical protein GALMADRAFT_234626 [Galerina marginata CBS 339.88]